MQERDNQASLESYSSTPEAHASKKRKMSEKVVVTVKIEEKNKKQQRNDGPPYDCWSWRKYGQKPIKGSPYPRGYYRCSTSKGCSAKKQVERCKTDAAMLIITYTSTHNHPGPDSPQPTNQKQAQTDMAQPTNQKQAQTEMAQPTSPKQEAQFEYSQSPFNSTTDNPFGEDLGRAKVEIPEPFCGGTVGFSSVMKTEENDFYDELEELPSSSFFTAFMRGSFCEESVAVNLSG